MISGDSPPRADPGPGRVPADQAGRIRAAAARRRRRRWNWLLTGLLLIFSSAVTGLFVATLTAAVGRHHWAQALDASRDAVPAAVGWAAVVVVLLARQAGDADQAPAADSQALREMLRRAAHDQEAARLAEQQVQNLAARLAALTAWQLSAETAGASPGQHLARQTAETRARLDRARQWLASAQDALTVSEAEATAARAAGAGDDEAGQVTAPAAAPMADRVA